MDAGQADPTADQITRNQLEGEVRFLGAYFYFKLVCFFGGVPLIESISPVEDINNVALQVRATREAVYARIVSDFRFAANVLPVKKQTATGKATKAAAMAMLAKIYPERNRAVGWLPGTQPRLRRE